MRKIVLITGTSTGLGASLAHYLHHKGYVVYGTSRKEPATKSSYQTLLMDVTDSVSVQAGIDAIVSKEGRLDVVINNAGLGIAGPLERLSLEDCSRVLDTNVLGIIRTSQAALPVMRRQGSGLIINISSIGAENGLPYRGLYSASKAAVDRITEALRLELAPFGIQACIVQPGGVRTEINNNRIQAPLAGEDPYRESFETTYALINESVEGGLDPLTFGPLVDAILQSKHPKRLYRAGKPVEKLSVLLKRILPASRFERLIARHYKMKPPR